MKIYRKITGDILSNVSMKFHKKSDFLNSLIPFFKRNYIPVVICLVFFMAYLTLSLVKHYSYLSGYDLSIIDQAIWKYAHFKIPISTTHVYFDTPIYVDHLELILILLAPLYWVFNSAAALIVLQTVAVISSGIAVLLLTKKYKINNFLRNCILISYLSFFGLQFAIWSDVHSLIFAVAFLSFFLYFLEAKKTKLTYLFLALAIISKEDIGLLTLLISVVYFVVHRNKTALICGVISIVYLFAVFYIYFPNILPEGYRFAGGKGLLSDVNPLYLIDSQEKQKTFLYSLGWFGFLPLLSPLYLLPFLGDLFHYFVIGHIAIRTEGIFLHYRSTVGLLLIWPTIIALAKFKKLNKALTGIYLLLFAVFFQYYLHLPLSYLTKKYFWSIPPEVKNINQIIKLIPSNASVVTQINIGAHLAHRDYIYTLFPSLKDFRDNSPCASKTCRWFRVGGNPKYLLVDIGETWNSLHYLGSRDDFMHGILNLERNGNITLIKQIGTSRLYIINKRI